MSSLMRSPVKLSVIVPVYNMAADGRLAYCLDSLLAQTLKEPYEIIAVDDASTDRSPEILREYGGRYPEKIRVIQNKVNRRQGGAKNAGLEVAVGEWVGFVDSDDWVAPDYYEKLLQKADETGADLVGCDYSLVSGHTMKPGDVRQNNFPDQTGELDDGKRRKLFLRPGSMPVKIYRRDVIVENGLCFPERIFYEDNCASPLWNIYFKHFERVEEPLYFYYQHSASTVHGITEERCRDRLAASECLYRECLERGLAERYHAELEYHFAELYYMITLFSYMSGIKHPRLAFIRELREGLESRFPKYYENPYYLDRIGSEEQRLIRMQRKSDIGFFCYYLVRQRVWNLKKRLRGGI